MTKSNKTGLDELLLMREKPLNQQSRAEEAEKINTDVRERFITILATQIPSSGPRYKYLEKRYGISARRWQNVYNRAQLPGIDMLVSIMKDYPYLTSWLLFGKTVNTLQIDPTEEGWERKLNEEYFELRAAK
jgi:hypothetical protein